MIVPEALLAPIPGDMPQGIDLRNPSRKPPLYDALAALRTARQREDAADPAIPPDWRVVEQLCGVILTDHSKDTEAVAGLTEALVRNDGFAGLAAAGVVITGLTERFWPALFPAPEEDEPDVTPEEARLEPLHKLVDDRGRLFPAIRRTVLFTLDDGTDFSLIDCMASKTWTALRPEERSKRLGALSANDRADRERSPGGRLWDAVRQAAAADPNGTLAVTRMDAAAAVAAWQAGADAIRTQPGGDAFSCQALLSLLGDVLRTITEIAPAEPAPTDTGMATEPEQQAAEQMTLPPGTPTLAAAPQALANREDALRRLEEITAFFRRTEPYSPVAFTLDEAMRRARLSWPEWLAEAVPDRQQRDAILTRLGLRPEAG
jgi:type VI secretion system protein ImpA